LAVGVALKLAGRIHPADLLQLALALLLAFLVTDHVLKPLVGRERPFVSMPDIRIIGGPPTDASFPSGHAASAFAACEVLVRLVPAERIMWWTMALVIAYSRVYLGVHYPLDVIAGAVLGWVCGIVVDRLVMRPSRRTQ
jgi:undecaprenyl-diphosphatase